jgi:hypothetical protein
MMGEKKDKAPAKQARLMHICPACGKTVDMSRRYCDCHASLNRAATTVSAEPPEVKPTNFETEGLNCGDCPESCLYCASFGEPAINSDGYGGKDCKHWFGSAKCHCCQAQVDLAIAMRDKVNLSQLVRSVLESRRAAGKAEDLAGKNIFLEAADVIREQMEAPVLNRIKQRQEQAG